MSLQSYVVKRAGSARYYARLAVPHDLQALMAKKEFWKSLGTADPRTAKSRAASIVALWRAELDEVRRKRAPSEDDLQNAVWRHYEQELEHDRIERLNLPKAATIDAAKAAYMEDVRTGKADANSLDRLLDLLAVTARPAMPRQLRAVRMKELKKHLAVGETEPIRWAVAEVIREKGWLIQRDTPAWHDLAQQMQRAELEALKRAAERDEGEWGGATADPVVKAPAVTAAPSKAAAKTARQPGEGIMELYDRFRAEKAGSASADTWTQNRKLVAIFADFLGGEATHISAVDRRAVRDWKQSLARWPLKAFDVRAFAGMSFSEIIEANAKERRPTINEKTVNKYLSAIGAFGAWLLANGYVEQSLVEGLYLDVDKRKSNRLPFSDEQLSALFTSPLFAGFKADGKEHLAGAAKADDWRTWLPLLALYSGARLGELAQLHTADVRQMHGTWILHFTEEGGGKSLKTAGSARVVPIHSELVRLGFLGYHTRMTKAGNGRLFPEIEPDERGFMSGTPSSFFRRYIMRIGLKTHGLTFHSFRHGFADALRRAGYVDEQFGFLLGHTRASTTGIYGIIQPGVLEQRKALVEAVNFPGLDLSALHIGKA